MARGVWRATVHGVAKSRTQLITHKGNSFWLEKARDFQKSIYFCFIDYAKAFDCVDHKKTENSERDGKTRPTYLPPEKSVCRLRSNS